MTMAHLIAGRSDYVRIESPDQVEPGDSVFEVVRYGQRDSDIKFNELRVVTVERMAVKAVRVGSPGSPIKLSFKTLVMRAPDAKAKTGGVVRRLPAPASAPPPVASQSPDFAAYIEMTRDVLQEVRASLRSVSDKKAEVIARAGPLETQHRARIEQLQTELEKAMTARQRDKACADAAIEALDAQAAELEGRITGIESMLRAVCPDAL